MKWFDYAAPQNLADAVALFAARPRAQLLAGGTDLLGQLRSGKKETDLVVDVKDISDLNELSYSPALGLIVGSAVPCCSLYEAGLVRRAYPALADVAALIGGIQIQSRASIGGNLCNAAPSADSVPVLIALGAVCRIAGADGCREVAVEDFCTAPGHTVLRSGELLVSMRLPPPGLNSGAAYLRFIPRNEMDIAVAGAAATVVLEDGVFRSARIALAAVAPTPLFVKEAGDFLAGRAVTPETISAAADIARRAAQPITDMRGTAEYRRHITGVLTRRALERAIERARDGIAAPAESWCQPQRARRPADSGAAAGARARVRTTVNGEPAEFLCEPRQSLLECLRDILGLTGTKEGCNDGNCGACTVLLDGRVVNACLVLGVEADGREITTIEGIARGTELHPLQRSFLENAALQCGFCTPGLIVAAKALLDREPDPSEERIRLWLANNLCRCTGYDKVVRAVRQAAETTEANA